MLLCFSLLRGYAETWVIVEVVVQFSKPLLGWVALSLTCTLGGEPRAFSGPVESEGIHFSSSLHSRISLTLSGFQSLLFLVFRLARLGPPLGQDCERRKRERKSHRDLPHPLQLTGTRIPGYLVRERGFSQCFCCLHSLHSSTVGQPLGQS